jgi:hypothetical protein
LGGWGTGGCTNGGSWWYRYVLRPYESISWIITSEYNQGDYDLYLWNYPNHDTLLASAVKTTYPDTLKYNNGGAWRDVFLQVKYYSGYSGEIFYLANIRRPTSSSNPIILRVHAFHGQPNPNYPTDGVEGYNPYANQGTEREHWYQWIMDAGWGGRYLRLCLRNVAIGADYDLYVYDQNFNLIASATGTYYPDITDPPINCSQYLAQKIYIRVYAYDLINAEYRIDFYSLVDIEEDTQTPKLNFSLLTSNPTKNEILIKYTLLHPDRITLTLYDSEGRLISRIINDKQFPGTYSKIINLRKLNISKGIYFLQFKTKEVNEKRKIVVCE